MEEQTPTQPQAAPRIEEIVLARPPEPRTFYYILSFLIFPVGIFLGLVYPRKDGWDNVKFGTRALVSGFILPAILIFIGIVSLLLLG